MDKKTIIFCIGTLARGGAERVILQLAYQFGKAGYRPVVVTAFVAQSEYPVPEGVMRKSIEQEEIIQSRLKRTFSRIRALRRICKEEKAIAVISFMRSPNFMAMCATRGIPVKTITSVRSDPEKEYAGKLGRLVGKLLIPMADGCVFQTEQVKAWFPPKLQEKSAVILNQVSEAFFQAARASGQSVVTLGRLDEEKNHKMLIGAFAKVAHRHPERELRIYGAGPLQTGLQELIDSLGLRDRVKLMGLTTDAVSVLRQASVFVLSSDFEGMPNALMEALAVGVPCISTDCPCGGPAVLIEDGVNGLLVPVGDEDKMARALDKLLCDEAYAQKLGAEAKKRAAEYHPERVFSQWKQYVESVIGR